MEIRPTEHQVKDLHKLIIGCVVPRPIAWVTSLAENERVNLAPFSFFNGVCSNPPTVSISFSWNPGSDDHLKDTWRNIRARGEFVVNMVDEAHAERMNLTSADFPPGESELEYAGLETAAPATGATPRIAGAPVCFECSLSHSIDIGEGPGSATLVLGTVRHVYVADGIIDDRLRVDVHALRPVGRLAGAQYCRVRDVFEMPRPSYTDLRPEE